MFTYTMQYSTQFTVLFMRHTYSFAHKCMFPIWQWFNQYMDEWILRTCSMLYHTGRNKIRLSKVYVILKYSPCIQIDRRFSEAQFILSSMYLFHLNISMQSVVCALFFFWVWLQTVIVLNFQTCFDGRQRRVTKKIFKFFELRHALKTHRTRKKTFNKHWLKKKWESCLFSNLFIPKERSFARIFCGSNDLFRTKNHLQLNVTPTSIEERRKNIQKQWQ